MLLQIEMTDFPILLYTSSTEIPTLLCAQKPEKVSSFGRSSTENYRVYPAENFVSPFLHQTMEKEKETGNEVADIVFYDGFIEFL